MVARRIKEELRDDNNKVSQRRKEQMLMDTDRKGQSLLFLPKQRRENNETDGDRHGSDAMEGAEVFSLHARTAPIVQEY